MSQDAARVFDQMKQALKAISPNKPNPRCNGDLPPPGVDPSVSRWVDGGQAYYSFRVAVKFKAKHPKGLASMTVWARSSGHPAGGNISGDPGTGECSEMVQDVYTFYGRLTVPKCGESFALKLFVGDRFQQDSSVSILDVFFQGLDPTPDQSCPECSFGSQSVQGSVNNSSVSFSIPFGLDGISATNSSSGFLSFYALNPSTNLFTPHWISYLNSGPGIESIFTNGTIRQIKCISGLADIVTLATNAFDIKIYPEGGNYLKAGGLWTTTNSAITTVMVRDSTLVTNSPRFQMILIQDGLYKTNCWTWIPANQAWSLAYPANLAEHTIACAFTNSNLTRIDTHTWQMPGTTNPTTIRTICYTNLGGTYFACEQREIMGSLTNCVRFQFVTDTNSLAFASHTSVIEDNGPWSTFDYDAYGRLSRIVSGNLDQAPTSNTNLCTSTVQLYSILAGSGDSGTDTNMVRTVIEYLGANEVG